MFYRQIGDGSARAETNSSQSVTSTLTPDAFGNAVATTGSTGSSYQFGATSGYRNDGDAGLLKVGCRYYDPQVGAFTTRGTYLDQKPYLYCEHDPVNAVDPSGHDPGRGRLLIGKAANLVIGGLLTVVIGTALIGVGWAFLPALIAGGFIGGFVSGGIGGLISGGDAIGQARRGAVIGAIAGPVRGVSIIARELYYVFETML